MAAAVALAAGGLALWLGTAVLQDLRGGRAEPGTSAATVQQRLLLWQAVVRAHGDHPGRMVMGFGPETLAQVLTPYVPRELAFSLAKAPGPAPEGFETLGQILFKDGVEKQLRGFVPVRFKVSVGK